MVQTGDPSGTGKGGQSIWGQPFPDEIRSTLKVSSGASLANKKLTSVQRERNSRHGKRGTGYQQVTSESFGTYPTDSQFFITYAKQSSLDGKYTIFGKVIDGADSTLDAIEKVPVNAKNRPLEEIRLKNVTIHANPIAEAQK